MAGRSRHHSIDWLRRARHVRPAFGHAAASACRRRPRHRRPLLEASYLARNAINGAARIIAALEAEQARLDTPTPLMTVAGNGTVVTTIAGGPAQNIVPDRW
ncbi:MAG: peptidase dimerization domain-containing protein [Acidimicrobiales bacterium]